MTRIGKEINEQLDIVPAQIRVLQHVRGKYACKRIGAEPPRATLANCIIRTGELIQPLINLMRDRLLAYDILQMDETTV